MSHSEPQFYLAKVQSSSKLRRSLKLVILRYNMSEVEDEKSWEDFCQKMKKATRSVHDLQDATIQALFVATLYVGGSQDLWFQALARFELVFNELEDCLDCQKKIQDFDVPGMR